MSCTSSTFLKAAASQIGVKEDPPSSNKVKYTDWYGLVGAWCDMFVSWCGDQVGATDIIGKFAWTPSHYQWFKDQGRAGQNPSIGAIVFFRFYGDVIHHVGIVEKINADGSIQTIEGNTDVYGGRTGGQVMRKVRSTGIVGYGYPNYATPVIPKAGQLEVDGYPGKLTISKLQKVLGVPVNGALDITTKKAWQKKVSVAVDGVLGPKSWRAIQLQVGATQDGVEGPKTWMAVQNWLNHR